MRSLERSSFRSRPARSGFCLCASSIKVITCRRSCRQSSASAAICSRSTILSSRCSRITAPAISLAPKCDWFRSILLAAHPRSAISERTQSATSAGAAARATSKLRFCSSRNFAWSPSGVSTSPPAIVCCSDGSRITKRSPANAKIGDASFSCAMVFSPGTSRLLSR